MDKQGALFFKLLMGLFALILAGYAAPKLFSGGPAYELQSAQICEVGDGVTVSGFVVRYERLLYSSEPVSFVVEEGRWVGGTQTVATFPGGVLAVPQGGYVSRTVDGYEGILTPEFVLHARGTELADIEPDKPPTGAVGRLIYGQSWYFAAPGDFPALSVGQELSLKIEEVECDARVLRTQGLLLLECNRYLHALTELRHTVAELCTGTVTGLQVPKEAIYYRDGESCVYILRGARAKQTGVRILRLQEDTALIHPEDLPEGAQVILTEKEITDGMVLK